MLYARIKKLRIFDIQQLILTRVLREAYREGRSEDLLLEQVLLVEEEDDGGVAEPLVVADRVEQLQALLHAILKRGKIGFESFSRV